METFATPQPTQPIEPRTTNWPKILLATVLGLGLLAGAICAGYWYGTESAKLKTQISKPPASPAGGQPKTQNQTIPTPTPTPTPTPNPTPEPTPTQTPAVEDETKDWKTYTNTKYGYLAKYPQDWVELGEGNNYVRFFKGPYERGMPMTETYVSINSKGNDSKISLDQWLIENGILPSTGDPAIESEDVVIDGVKGKQFISARDGGKIIYLPYGSYVFQLTNVLMGESTEEAKTVFDLILSTFRFLD
jgi:hypothetical protein